MAAIDTHRSAATFSAFRFTAVATRLIGVVNEWNDARNTRKCLSALSARELDDIGLSYADIESVATRTVR